jgi:hypothetical protein
MYSGTPVTRPTMGPMSDGRVTGVVASVKLKIWSEFPAKKLGTIVSLACMIKVMHKTLWAFHYFLENDYSDINIIIGFIISS